MSQEPVSGTRETGGAVAPPQTPATRSSSSCSESVVTYATGVGSDHSPARAREDAPAGAGEERSGHEHDQVDEQQGDQVAEELAGLSAEEIRAWIRRRVLHKGHPGRSPLEPPILAAESV